MLYPMHSWEKGHVKGLFNSCFAFPSTIWINFLHKLWITGAMATIRSRWVKRNSPELNLLPTLLKETYGFGMIFENYMNLYKHLLDEVSMSRLRCCCLNHVIILPWERTAIDSWLRKHSFFAKVLKNFWKCKQSDLCFTMFKYINQLKLNISFEGCGKTRHKKKQSI